ncbi:MAG TPA: hypothetical protein VG963_13025, partial [Polyangiaceae bacterium]|nr:hypothetical protein [Polyangiaceae bacterium]
WLLGLAEFRSAHHLRIRVARDYQSDGAGGWAYFDDVIWTPTTSTIGGAEQFRHGCSVQQGEAFKVRITGLATDDTNPPSGEAFKLVGLAFEVGIKRGLNRRLAAAQKV